MITVTETLTRNNYFVQQQTSKSLVLLKRAVWLYILLLIFEGALRKWFLPFLAAPLLVVRDPLALFILLIASRQKLLPFNFFAFSMIIVCLVSFFTTLLIGHGNLYVALYGARILLIQFPLIFAIGRILDREDVIKVGKFIVYLTPFMTILIALQFYSPQTAWVNRGVGGDVEGAGFNGGALDYLRPPGTFSFTNGLTLFYAFATPFVFYFWLQRSNINKLALLAATAGLLAAIPLSISRSLLFSVVLSFIFVIIASFYKPKFLGAMLLAGIGGIAAFVLLSNAAFFQTATEAFSTRIENANGAEGGLNRVLGDRYLGGLISSLTYSSVDYPFWGRGLGMGTNVGAMLLSGERDFLIAEGEWGRMIGEMGPLLGLLTILIRLLFSASLAVGAFKRLSAGDLLPWFLLSFALLNIPQGQWAQPTSLGFSIVAGGLILASFREG